MIRVCFVCLGNICRSPMAEFIMKDKVNKHGISDKFLIESRATSYEESGNDMHYGAKEMLDLNNIPYSKRRATRVEATDLDKFDYFICMDASNYRNLSRILNDSSKISILLDRDVADPWYTGNFKVTYDDLCIGIDKLIKEINR